MPLARVALALCVFVLSFTTAPLAVLAALHRSQQVETSQQSGKAHLPHARTTRHASEHAFAGEVEQPQATTSPIDVTWTSIAPPRIARVGASPEETGLSATRFRMWEAETGRWLSPDPLGIIGGVNLLGFDGAPTTGSDPLGLCKNTPAKPIDEKAPVGVTKETPLNWSIVSKTGETRPAHVELHGANNLQKASHGVFYGPPVATVNDAWRIGQRTGVQPVTIGGTDIYVIPRPNSGWAGGFAGQGQNLDTVTIVTQKGTTNIITGFPGNGLPTPKP